MRQSAYSKIIDKIRETARSCERNKEDVRLICVSKTFAGEQIVPVLEEGARIFGENRVQEAQSKWPQLKEQFDAIELHLIGPLQSNKAGDAVALFDVIHTIDREKIANAISREIKKQNKNLQLFVQVNTGSEPQKAGVDPSDTVEFVALCRDKYDLAVNGLMCIPPNGENPGPHFALLRKLSKDSNCPNLSMGMSGDFDIAIEFGATHIRVGSAIFGQR